MPMMTEALAWGPASTSNLGPGFDALGAALTGLGDEVMARKVEGNDVRITWHTDSAWTGPTDPNSNTAAVAARSVLNALGRDTGVELLIRKGLSAGTGLGSSAASAVAAAVATDALFGGELSRNAMIEAVISGESAVSGVGHGDNVLPSLLGGFVLMRSANPMDHVRLAPWPTLGLVVLRPEMTIMTREARTVLPGAISLSDTVDHAARLALLVDALHRHDVEALGHWMMSDTIVEPARAGLLPHAAPIRKAALEAGAAGCTVSGSGPAMIAVHETPDTGAEGSEDAAGSRIARAMLEVCQAQGWKAEVSLHRVSDSGACLMDGAQATSWLDGARVPSPAVRMSTVHGKSQR